MTTERRMPIPVSDSVKERMVHKRLQRLHPAWHWQLSDEAAARTMLQSQREQHRLPVPSEAIEALVEARETLRHTQVIEVSNMCADLEQAYEMALLAERDREDEQ